MAHTNPTTPTSPSTGSLASLKRSRSTTSPTPPTTLPHFESLYGSDGRAKYQKFLKDTGQNTTSEAWRRESEQRGWSLSRLYLEREKPFRFASRFGGDREVKVPAPGQLGKGGGRGRGRGKKRVIGVRDDEDGDGEADGDEVQGVGARLDGEGVVGKGSRVLERLERKEAVAEERYAKRREEGRVGSEGRLEVRRSPLGRECWEEVE
ncbi:MAG: hypothetical protein Q9227_009223 [Pyrenula ochraceoflavens]